MHFLGCLFALVLGVIFIGVTFIGSIIDFILSLLGLNKRVTNNSFGGGFNSQQRSTRQGNTHQGNARQGDYGSQQQQSTSGSSRGQQKGKIFTKDESEYVDFEEI